MKYRHRETSNVTLKTPKPEAAAQAGRALQQVATMLLTVLAGSPSLASESPPSVAVKTLAAGYKAQFTCSATFNGGKSKEQISAHELSNIGAELTPVLSQVGAAVIDRDRQLVSVSYDDAMPPRIAAWRPHLGCASLPPGATAEAVTALPSVRLRRSRQVQSEQAWPQGDRLPTLSAAQQRVAANLDAPIRDAFAGLFGGVTSAVAITHQGVLLKERYLTGTDANTSQRTWSVAKSIAATVIGAAVHRKLLSVEQPTGLAAWDRKGDPRQAITIEHLLHMSSGLDSDAIGSRTPEIYFGGGLVDQEILRRRLIAVPGTLWQYANNDTMLLMLTLRERLRNRDRYLKFPFEQLLHPIGMTRTVPETDWDGNFVMSSQVWTTARDLTRLGLLYLNDGVWNGKRLLPEGWVDYVRTPAPAQPPERRGRPNFGYGGQFWLIEGAPSQPASSYAALGNRGQLILIVPDEQLVVVRRGYDYAENRFDGVAFLNAIRQQLSPQQSAALAP